MKNLFILTSFLFLFSCTEQSRARHWGGQSSLVVPEPYALVNITFKESDLWILARNKNNPCEWVFYEDSSWDVMEGKFYITSCDTLPNFNVQKEDGTPIDTFNSN